VKENSKHNGNGNSNNNSNNITTNTIINANYIKNNFINARNFDDLMDPPILMKNIKC
jgi:hypothetical protein